MFCFAEQTDGKADSVAESLTDTDSVRGLGETTDFLNMVRKHLNIFQMFQRLGFTAQLLLSVCVPADRHT